MARWKIFGIKIILFFFAFYVITYLFHSFLVGIVVALCLDILFLYWVVKKEIMKKSKMCFTDEEIILHGMIPLEILGIILFIYIFVKFA